MEKKFSEYNIHQKLDLVIREMVEKEVRTRVTAASSTMLIKRLHRISRVMGSNSLGIFLSNQSFP